MRLSSFALAALALVISAASPSVAAPRAQSTQPIVVELFTAEGCGACPPADAILERLAREQPVNGAEVLALELHVDYFDRPGAVDPFAQKAFGARQADYIKAFGKRGAYTPQMVIDGQVEIVGAREQETEKAITEAARAPKAKVKLARNGDALSITVEGLDAGGNEAVDVMVALAEEGLTSSRPGSRTVHGPVVRELQKVGTISGRQQGPVELKDVEIHLDRSMRRENVRAVAFLQRSKTLEIVGAGAIAMK
jgi:hypothetical protein